MKKILMVLTVFLLGLFGAASAEAQEGRHFVLQGDDAMMPIGITDLDTLELADYHGDWSRFSNLGAFVIGSDAHIDYRNVREVRNLMVNNTERFVNNGKITLNGEVVKLGELVNTADKPAEPILDLRGGVMLFENIIYEGNGSFEFPVVEALDQSERPTGQSAVAGKLVFEGGVVSAPIYISLERYGSDNPLIPSELVVMRKVRLENGLTTDLAVVLQTKTLGNTPLTLLMEEVLGKDEGVTYIWRVEPVR